jgi:hypothetical protein
MGWTAHHWFMLYIAAAVVLFYIPPKSLSGVGNFISAHFGDSIGVYLLHLSLGMLIIGGFYPQLTALVDAGKSIFSVSLAVLKLTNNTQPVAPKPLEPPKP